MEWREGEFGCPPSVRRFAWPDCPHEQFVVVDYHDSSDVRPGLKGFYVYLATPEGEQRCIATSGKFSDRDPFDTRDEAVKMARGYWGELPVLDYVEGEWPPSIQGPDR